MAAWVIISGSPYGAGKCANLARRIASALKAGVTNVKSEAFAKHATTSHDLERQSTANDVQIFTCVDLRVHGCIGCDRCKEDLTCIYQDDHQALEEALVHADALLVISPIYFAGVPSQFKAVLDRFQPYYWKRQRLLARDLPLPEKRPLYLAVVGEGGDPFGAEPAFASIASPLALADFAPVYQQAFIKTDEDTIFSALLTGIEEADQAVFYKPRSSSDSSSVSTHKESL